MANFCARGFCVKEGGHHVLHDFERAELLRYGRSPLPASGGAWRLLARTLAGPRSSARPSPAPSTASPAAHSLCFARHLRRSSISSPPASSQFDGGPTDNCLSGLISTLLFNLLFLLQGQATLTHSQARRHAKAPARRASSVPAGQCNAKGYTVCTLCFTS